MAVSLENSPALVAPAGNLIGFKLQTDNNIETPGVKSKFQVNFLEVALEDDTMTFAWANEDLEFTFKDAPDDSGLQLPTSPAGLNDWVAAVAVAMDLNYLINRDFLVSSIAGSLIFNARNTGAKYDITWSVVWAGANDPTDSLITAGVDEVPRPFFKIGLQVLISSGADFIKIAEDLLPVDANKQALFDIRETFTDYIDSEFKFPESSVELMIERPNINREYLVRFYERFGSDITPQKMTESTSFWALNAGLSKVQEAIYNRQDSSYWDKLTYDNWFLTWQPKTKFVDRYQIEKLYFLVQDATVITELNLRVLIHYNNDTETIPPHELKDTIAGPVDKAVYEISCTLNTLQIFGYDDDSIEYYEVWIEDQNYARISEIRRYVMDYEYHEHVRIFLFRSSLGGFDTLRCTGDFVDSLEHNRTEISKVLGEDFTEKDHQIAAGKVTESKVYQANTGWKTLEDITWIRDFLLSKQVYQTIVGKLMPVVITSTRAIQRADKQDLYSISFTYRRAYENEFFSKQLAHADFNDDFNDDFANE